jgi:hypothetical protein
MYGRTELEWEQLRQAAEAFLAAKARERGMTTYTDLNRELTETTGLPGFDYSQESERAAVGRLLGEISRKTYEDHGIMLSALVTHQGSNNEGAGFYKLAADLGVMTARPSAAQKLEAFARLVGAVHDHYASHA